VYYGSVFEIKKEIRMKSLLIAILLAAASLAQTATPAPTVAQLLGTWKLVSIEDTMNDGKVQPSTQYGPHPHGFIMYQPDGYMCASIVNSDRPAWKDPAKATDAEKIAYYDSFLAYCGTFKLDSATSTVTRLVAVLCRLHPAATVSPRGQPANHYSNTRSFQFGDPEAGAGVGAGEMNPEYKS
jgi:hypothetical protein